MEKASADPVAGGSEAELGANLHDGGEQRRVNHLAAARRRR